MFKQCSSVFTGVVDTVCICRKRSLKHERGLPWWPSRFRIRHCHCCGSCSVPGLGGSTCCGRSQNPPPRNKKISKNSFFSHSCYYMLCHFIRKPVLFRFQGPIATKWQRSLYLNVDTNILMSFPVGEKRFLLGGIRTKPTLEGRGQRDLCVYNSVSLLGTGVRTRDLCRVTSQEAATWRVPLHLRCD